MFLHSLEHALPPHRYTPADCLAVLDRSPAATRLRPPSLRILRHLLRSNMGIATRHFARPDLGSLFDFGAGDLARYFEDAAPKLAADAVAPALAAAGITPSELDALFVCTCTGYLCPGVSSHLAEQLGLREDAYLADFVGLGCGAAIPTLRAARGFLAERPDAHIAMVAVEVCSAAFHLDDDRGVLVSACLFADGASASIWSGSRPAERPALSLSGFDTVHRPALRETIRFVNADGRLRNQLAPSVPADAADAVAWLWARAQQDGVSTIVTHGGGRDVIEAIEARLPDWPLPWTRDVLERAGNLSSPSVLLALQDCLEERLPSPGEAIWMSSFGAGFAAHAARLERLAD